MDNNTILKIENLSISFGGLKAVDDLSFEIKEKNIFGLIGPNGAGKTTVFNCITQFYKPDTGKIFFRNKEGNIINLTEEKVYKIINQGLVRTFQNLEIIKELSVIDNILVGSHIFFKSNLVQVMLKTKKAKLEERTFREKAEEILKFLKLSDIKDTPAGALPYGVLKKIELGRTLISDPKLIILDEPAAGLNDTETLQLSEMIKEVRDKYNCSILLVEHDMRLVMDICDRICAISFGKHLATGNVEEIQKNAQVQEAYLGKEDD